MGKGGGSIADFYIDNCLDPNGGYGYEGPDDLDDAPGAYDDYDYYGHDSCDERHEDAGPYTSSPPFQLNLKPSQRGSVPGSHPETTQVYYYTRSTIRDLRVTPLNTRHLEDAQVELTTGTS